MDASVPKDCHVVMNGLGLDDDDLITRAHRPLVVFDLNGVLGAEVPHDATMADVEALQLLGLKVINVVRKDRTISRRYVLRPGIQTYLLNLSRVATIATWTSTTLTNAFPPMREAVSTLAAADKKLHFNWFYKDCVLADPVDPAKLYAVVKPVERILRHPVLNAGRKYYADNVFIVDDHPEKVILQDPVNQKHMMHQWWDWTSVTLKTLYGNYYEDPAASAAMLVEFTRLADTQYDHLYNTAHSVMQCTSDTDDESDSDPISDDEFDDFQE